MHIVVGFGLCWLYDQPNSSPNFSHFASAWHLSPREQNVQAECLTEERRVPALSSKAGKDQWEKAHVSVVEMECTNGM